MFWKWLERLTTLSFLLLAITLTVILSNNNISDRRAESYALELQDIKTEIRRVQDSNLYYLEGKANKISESQDNYQISASNRLSILEDRVKAIEQENKILKNQQKSIITNNNNNINVVNGMRKQPSS